MYRGMSITSKKFLKTNAPLTLHPVNSKRVFGVSPTPVYVWVQVPLSIFFVY